MNASLQFTGFYSRTPADSGMEVVVEASPGYLAFTPPGDIPQKWMRSDCRLELIPGSRKWSIVPGQKNSGRLRVEDEQAIRSLLRQGDPFLTRGNPLAVPGRMLIRGILVAAIGLLIALGLFLWKGLPWLGDEIALRIPEEWEEQLGLEMDRQIRESFTTDTARTRLLNQWYRTLPAQPTEKETPVRLVVINDPSFNAFAIPGRRIYVHTGALERVGGEPELLALLGHEAGHVRLRHPLRGLVRSASGRILLSLLLGDSPGESGLWAGRAQELRELAFSRDFEREADEAAHRFLCACRADPRGLEKLMEIIREKGGDSGPGDFLRTHPSGEERRNDARERIKNSPCPPAEPVPATRREAFRRLKYHGDKTGTF